ncbi:MAG: haloacid dehalogenase type II [Acidobacteria bacterium]|nr:haloacid dehalogenase type II [Acidobacteriota bacterium]
MKRILVFDVNETLLDVQALDPVFDDAFGRGDARREWFSTLLLYSGVASLAGPYEEFSTIAGAALDMTAERRGVRLSAVERTGILRGMLALPAHPDVPRGLQRLRDAGFRLVALSNSSQAALEAQLTNAGLSPFFERRFSVEAVRRFKPAAEVYQLVARELGVGTGDLRMVAAHAWDIVGAMRAGCSGAFVARPGAVWYPLAPRPDVVGPDLPSIAQHVIALESAAS